MVRHWLPLRFSLSQILIFAAETFVEHIYITGYYDHDIELCFAYVAPAPIWIPPFAFEAILALLAVWAGIKHSRQEFRSQPVRFNKSQLVGSLIHGNVVYFVGWESIYHCWTGSDYKTQSTRHICSTSQCGPEHSMGGTGPLLGRTSCDIRWLSPYSFNPRGGFFAVFNISLQSHSECICSSRWVRGKDSRLKCMEL